MWRYLLLYLLSLLPGFEGRYAVVTGLLLKLPLPQVLLVSSLGVLTLATLLTQLLNLIDQLLQRLLVRCRGVGRRILTLYLRYRERVKSRCGKYVGKWGTVGLTLFVAVPLPATGLWTGALAAYLLGLRGWRVFLALLLGGLLSNTFTLLLTVPLWWSSSW